MAKYKFLDKEGNIHIFNNKQLKENFNTTWEKLHRDFDGIFSKEFKTFLDKFNLPPTHFNLNCLNDSGMVALSDSQINNLKM